MVREAHNSDAQTIAEIYNHYIIHTAITFETETISPKEIVSRMEKYKQVGPTLYTRKMEKLLATRMSQDFGKEKLTRIPSSQQFT